MDNVQKGLQAVVCGESTLAALRLVIAPDIRAIPQEVRDADATWRVMGCRWGWSLHGAECGWCVEHFSFEGACGREGTAGMVLVGGATWWRLRSHGSGVWGQM